MNGLAFWRRCYTRTSTPDSPEVKILWCHVTTQVGSPNHRINGTSSAASVSGVTHGRGCLCVQCDFLLWPGRLRWACCRKETRPTINRCWPKVKGESKYLRKYLPNRLFLRKLLRVVKYI